jgi:cysteine desulfurase/selenocysteine lyase
MALKPDTVIDAVTAYYRDFPGCGGVGRSDHAFGRRVEGRVYEAREAIRRFVNARPSDGPVRRLTPTQEIVFTRNATEAINLVARGFPFTRDAVVLTTDREHSSNLCPWQDLAAAGRIRHLWVPSQADNRFDLDAFAGILEDEAVELVSMVHVSNFDGYEIPAQEIIRLAHDHGACVLLDAAQSAPHLPIDVQALDVDFLALSVHKLCGPTGVGVLYGKAELLNDPAFAPLVTGGDTVVDTALGKPPQYHESPFRFEAGLQDYAGITGAASAVAFVESIGLPAISAHTNGLNRRLWEQLKPFADEFDVIGPADPELRNGITTLCFRRRGIPYLCEEDISGSGDILEHWDGIMARTGEFCAHSWFNSRGIGREREKLRVSFYFYNSDTDCDRVAAALRRLFQHPDYQMLPKLA